MSDWRDESNESTSPGAGATDGSTTCVNCGRRIDTDEWHPVYTERIDGDFRLYPFCDDVCRDEWLRDRSGSER